jgi:hypothetical protein
VWAMAPSCWNQTSPAFNSSRAGAKNSWIMATYRSEFTVTVQNHVVRGRKWIAVNRFTCQPFTNKTYLLGEQVSDINPLYELAQHVT